MKLTKMDCTLNEKDTLQDMLESEKQLMELYTVALKPMIDEANETYKKQKKQLKVN